MAARAPKIAKQLNISLSRIEDFLKSKGFDIEIKPTTKINDDQYNLLLQEFSQDVSDKVNIKEAIDSKRKERESASIEFDEKEKVNIDNDQEQKVEKIEVENNSQKKDLGDSKVEEKSDSIEEEVEPEINKQKFEEKTTNESNSKLKGPIVTGERIDLSQFEKKQQKVASSSQTLKKEGKKKRKRIFKDNQKATKSSTQKGTQMDDVKIQKKIAETLDKLTNKGKSSSVKFRKKKREERRERALEEQKIADQEKSILKVTEFVTVGELASMMDINPNEVISSCMTLGIMVAMNQRLDAETLSIVAEEFGFQLNSLVLMCKSLLKKSWMMSLSY